MIDAVWVLEVTCANVVHKECSSVKTVLGVFMEKPTKELVDAEIKEWQDSRSKTEKTYYELTSSNLFPASVLKSV